MADLTIAEVMAAIAAQITDTLCADTDPVIPDLQVDGMLIPVPTPPAVDIYPGDPFQQPLAFGVNTSALNFIVRARVTTADNPAGQSLLLAMMDETTAESLAAALEEDATLDGQVSDLSVGPPSDYGLFVDPGQTVGLLGCTWPVTVIR